MKYLSLFLLMAVSSIALAQNDQAEYLEAKRLFNNRQYASAKASFGALSESKEFGRYSKFYYALSSYHQGDLKQAIGSWERLLKEQPKWEHRSELFYWISKAQFEEGNHREAILASEQYSQEVENTDLQKHLTNQHLSALSMEELEVLFIDFPNNREIASLIISKINQTSYTERDFKRVERLAADFDIKMSDLPDNQYPLITKKAFDIAVTMPFLYESLENTAVISQNKFVMDMYQGMLMAAEDLTAVGYPINLKPHDTKRSKDVTAQLLIDANFKNYDMIVGPLFLGPMEVMDEFSEKNKINRMNPISSNSEAIGENRHSFLIRPTYETMAREMAELAASENDGTYALIYYEQSDRDSIFAARYKEAIENAGYEVALFQPITRDNSRELLEVLWAQYDDYLSQEEADSISEADPTRFIKSRRIRRDEVRRMNRDTTFMLPVSFDEDENEIVFYEKMFELATDSIGHILAATRSNLFANNLISAVETRGDSIRLYGYGDWLDFTMMSYSQLERLGVALTNPDFMDQESEEYKDLKSQFESRYKTVATINHFRGYETVYFAGLMMHQHGKYFQAGIRDGEFMDGQVYEGYRYGAANDNQIVPIVRFKETKLEVVNSESYED